MKMDTLELRTDLDSNEKLNLAKMNSLISLIRKDSLEYNKSLIQEPAKTNA